MKQALAFAIVSAMLIVLCALGMTLVYGAPPERCAIMVSAVVAVSVQLVAYAIVRAMARQNVIAGWGLGAILRFATLAVFALVVVGRMGLPSGAATISLALFLFVSTLVEPLFLKT